MNVKVEFLLNGKIEIEMEDGFYKSNIQDITDDYIGISIPVNDGKYLPLRKDEKVRGVYYYGKDIYKFNTVVTGRKIENVLIIMLKKPENLTLHQRRNFVRVPLMVNLYCAMLNKDKDKENLLNNQIDFFDAYSLDISGGGMRIAIDRNNFKGMNTGNSILITIPMQDSNLTVKGKIVRIDDDKKNPRIMCGVSFVDLDKVTRECIIRYVFQVMRDQMKTGAKGD